MTPQWLPLSWQAFSQRSTRFLRSFSHVIATNAVKVKGAARPTVVIQGIVAIVAVVALIVSVTSIQASRERAAVDSCRLIRGLVLTATPRDRLTMAIAFLDKNGLNNCQAYAKKVTR